MRNDREIVIRAREDVREIARLRADLKKYGKHDSDCMAGYCTGRTDGGGQFAYGPCTCGLDKAQGTPTAWRRP